MLGINPYLFFLTQTLKKGRIQERWSKIWEQNFVVLQSDTRAYVRNMIVVAHKSLNNKLDKRIALNNTVLYRINHSNKTK